jgi:glycosyltransferase involved in cell wall biosynthesis
MILLSVYYKHKEGGFNQRLYRLFRAMARRGHRLHYVAVEPLPIRHPRVFPHIVPIPFKLRENAVFWAFFILLVPIFCLWTARRHRVSGVVVFSSFYAFICVPAVLLLGLEMVTFLRADVLREGVFEKKSALKGYSQRIFERIGLKCSRRVVVASETMRRRLGARLRLGSVSVLPNNIDDTALETIGDARRSKMRKRWGLSPDQFVVVTAAPLNRVKNIGFLIRAFGDCGVRDARLVIVGDDTSRSGERRRLEQLAAEQRLVDRIVFTGWLDDPRPTIAAADLFVLPSLQEGSPNALLEALACNLPCLGSRIAEIREILREDALLFSLDNPAELAEKIHRAAVDVDHRRHLARLCAVRRQVHAFDWDTRALMLVVSGRRAAGDAS